MKYEISYGIIPFKRIQRQWRILLVHHDKGHWAFPKGHADGTEEGQEAAIRELKEETNLSVVQFFNNQPFKEHYFFQQHSLLIDKTVFYWAAKVSGKIQIQKGEIAQAKWFSLEEAHKRATFAETKNLCHQLTTLLLP